MLITLYGINNIGKTTQAKALVQRLQAEGYDAVYVKYPVYEVEPTGVFLNRFLRDGSAPSVSEEELQMWFTLNRYQFEPQLKAWLEAGKIVIAEDYIGTGIAWGTVKGAATEWLESMNAHLIREDLALMVDGERFVEAMEDGHVHEANEELMQRSREVHLALAERYGWTVVPLVRGVEAMTTKLWDVLQLHLPEKSA